MLHRQDLREATRKEAEKRRRQRERLSPFQRLQSGEKKYSKRMATVAAVYTTAPWVRSPEQFLQDLMPPQPPAKVGNKPAPRPVRPRPMGKRVWASLEREAWEVVADATLEAEHRDPEHVKPWVVLVDGAEMQLAHARAAAAARGVDVTVIVDIIHVVEYVWKAAHAFHRAASPELACWAWTRVQRILEGKARTSGVVDAACGDRCRLVAGGPQAGGYLRRLSAQVCAVSAVRPLPCGGLSDRDRGGRGGLPASGARPDGADRGPLPSGRRRGGPEAAGAASERRLRRVLGLPRGARVRAEPRPAIRRRGATIVQRAPRTPVPETSPAGQVALLVMPFQRQRPPGGRRRKRATPFPRGRWPTACPASSRLFEPLTGRFPAHQQAGYLLSFGLLLIVTPEYLFEKGPL